MSISEYTDKYDNFFMSHTLYNANVQCYNKGKFKREVVPMRFWDRLALKTRAKDVLKKSYWMSLVALLIVSFIVSISVAAVSSIMAVFISITTALLASGVVFAGVVVYLIGLLFAYALIFIVYAFLSGVLEIGQARFFTAARYGLVQLDELFVGFKKGHYMRNVKTMFFKYLYTFLWSLLFIVPGIIKQYSYFMIPYILAENPNILTQRAFEISMRATEGEKWEMFVLDLSFIGWMLLGALCCSIGQIFVMPYLVATRAELYGALRYKAVQLGICTKDEIGAEL